jgi:hypothetical protein
MAISPAPKNLSSDERALWFEQDGGCRPRGALMRLSYERFLVEEVRAERDRLRSLLADCAEYAPPDLQELAQREETKR